VNPITLTTAELNAVLTRVSPTGRHYGAGRIAMLLANHTGVRTRTVNQECSVGNISDIVSKLINPKIADLGFYIACFRPHVPFKNRYQQPTGEMLWSFYRDAANDSDYDSAGLARELNDHERDYPDLATNPRWEQAIEDVS
jgi:hypothetical protein